MGPGAPPIRTTRGWLEIFHAVETAQVFGKNGWEENWNKMYMAEVMLLDLEDPRKIIGLQRIPLMRPEATYEVSDGFRNNVVLPPAALAEPDGEIKIYYDASDTVICLTVRAWRN